MAQLNDLLVMGQSTLLGPVTLSANQYTDSYTSGYALNLNNSNIIGVNSIYMADLSDNASEGIHFYQTATTADTLWAKNGIFYFAPNRALGGTPAPISYQVLHSGGGPVDGQLKTSRTGARWIDARDTALIVYNTSLRSSSYSPLYSLKTVSGEVSSGLIYYGDKDGVPVEPDLVWVHNTDANYPNNNSTQTEMLRVSIEGAVTAKSYNASSDRRLKTNIQPFLPNSSILDLPLYKFDFINGTKNQIGCMAQDLREICPEIVTEDSDGYLSIQENKIVYLLIDEIKKLKAEIKILKEK